MSFRRCCDEVDSREFSEWQAFDRLSPIDHARRAELSAGIIASLIHNANVANSRDAKPASHFMQDWGSEYQEREPVANLSSKLDEVFGAIAKASGA